MNTSTAQLPKTSNAAHRSGQSFAHESEFTSLNEVVRPYLTTAEAAFYMNRKQQTLRIWASRESGPVQPVRIHGRLAWSTRDVRTLLGYLPEEPAGKPSGPPGQS